MSAGFAVVASLGDGVERLLTLHAQSYFLLSDRGWSSFSQLHATLKQKHRELRPGLRRPQDHRGTAGGVLCYRGVRRGGLVITQRTGQVSEALHRLLVALNGGLDSLKVEKKTKKKIYSSIFYIYLLNIVLF